MMLYQIKNYKLFFLALIMSLLFSCRRNGTDPIPQAPLPPGKAVLLLPAQNEVCATGENPTATQSTVQFDWTDAANANSYILNLKNLITGVITSYSSNLSELKITIPRAAAFSWTITSKSSKTVTTALSDSWKFYNSGEGQISYAPFPATLTYPAMGATINATSSINLTWTGSDADNDITGYDVYFGTTNTPQMVATNKADVQSYAAATTPGTIYYWKIVTKDSKGNTSNSGIYQFKIN